MNSIALPVVLPLLAAFLIPSLSRVSSVAGRALGPLVLVGSLIIIARTALDPDSAPFSVALGGFAPPLGINFYVDQVALLFAGLVAAMSLLLWPWGEQLRAREYSLSLLLASAATGLALSGDLFNIYVFYELLSVASFGLVASRNSSMAYAATFRYVVVSALGTVLALTGIALIYSATGTLNLAQLAQLAPTELAGPAGLAAFVLILIGVGVKAELFPVNTWVPEVYASAESRVTGLLAGLVSKLAVLVIVRMLVLVFPSEEARSVMLILGVLGVLAGELSAWRAQDFRRMLAYSSIGQLGIIFIAFSLPGEGGLFAGIALSLHHLVVKPALFMFATHWGGSLQRLRGVAWAGGRSMLAAGLFVLLALSLIGVPPLPGFWAKLLLVVQLVGHHHPLATLGLVAILTATVIEANYLFRLAVSMFTRLDVERHPLRPQNGVNLAGVVILALVLIAATLQITPLAIGLEDMAVQAANTDLYINTVFPDSVMTDSAVEGGQ